MSVNVFTALRINENQGLYLFENTIPDLDFQPKPADFLLKSMDFEITQYFGLKFIRKPCPKSADFDGFYIHEV